MVAASNGEHCGYGVGLKGINELFGQSTADRLIKRLMGIFSKLLHNRLVEKRILPEKVLAAQFVDRFTVCCEQPVFHPQEIIELVRGLAALYNADSEEIKISHLRISIILGETNVVGYRLFDYLALTSMAPWSSMLVSSDTPIEIRQNNTAALLEGRAALEKNTLTSVKYLASQNC